MEKITGEQFEAIYSGKTLADFKAEELLKADAKAVENAENADTAEAANEVATNNGNTVQNEDTFVSAEQVDGTAEPKSTKEN